MNAGALVAGVSAVRDLLTDAHHWLASGAPVHLTLNLLKSVFLLSVVTALAAFIYGTLYFIYIPKASLSKQVHFKRVQSMKVGGRAVTRLHFFSVIRIFQYLASSIIILFHRLSCAIAL